MSFYSKAMAGLISVAAMTAASNANAAVTVTIAQVGSDVVATTSGTFDVSGTTFYGNYGASPVLWGYYGAIALGADGGGKAYDMSSAVSAFGTGGFAPATSSSGLSVVVDFSSNYFGLGSGYVSNSAIVSTATWTNQTLAALGLTQGVYTGVAGTNAITVTIGSAVSGVPEPGTWSLMIAGFGMLGAATRYRRRTVQVRFG